MKKAIMIWLCLSLIPAACGDDSGGPSGICTRARKVLAETCGSLDMDHSKFFEGCATNYNHDTCGQIVRNYADCVSQDTSGVCGQENPCTLYWNKIRYNVDCSDILIDYGEDREDVGGGCGNGSCDAEEDCDQCPEDCGSCMGKCGDGNCDFGENCEVCEQDCGQCNSCFCDRTAVCNSKERCSTIPCLCDSACLESRPCIADGACDSYCPTGQDPDCVKTPLDGQYCNYCIPECEGLECGDNGCGGVCGQCEGETYCDEGLCKTVIPTGCGDCPNSMVCGGNPEHTTWCSKSECLPGLGYEGACFSDTMVTFCEEGYQYAIDCQTFSPGSKCVWDEANQFYDCKKVCEPSCGVNNCGDDGCGGTCGQCSFGDLCIWGRCTTTDCSKMKSYEECEEDLCISCGEGSWSEDLLACCQACAGALGSYEQCVH